MIYIIAYAFIIIFAIFLKEFCKFRIEKGRKIFILFSFTIMFLISALRSETVGVDTGAYTDIYRKIINLNFNNLHEIPETRTVEYPFLIFMKLLTFVNKSPQLFLIITSLIVCYGFGKFIYDNIEDAYVATIVFYSMFYFQSLSIIRQMMSIAIALNVITKINHKKFPIVLIISSFICHKSIFIFYLILILYLIRKKGIFIPLCILGISLLFIVCKTNLINILIVFAGYDYYIGSKYMRPSYLGGTIDKIYLLITVASAIILIYEFYKVKKTRTNKDFLYDTRFYIMMMFIHSALLLIARDFMVVMRVAMYFSVFVILMIPNIFKLLKRYRIINVPLLTICLLILSMVNSIDCQYQFFWN